MAIVRFPVISAVCVSARYVRSTVGWDGDGGETDVTDRLNDQIAVGVDGVYTGGRGMIIRNPMDGLEWDDSKMVVPSTFWVNDIYAPSQIYPSSGGGGAWAPWCPNSGTDGLQDITGFCDCEPVDDSGDTGPWNYAQLAYVVASAMPAMFTDWDNIQSDDWGWGVFYPTDSNSVDKRCRWLGDYSMYDCPGGYLPFAGDFVADDSYGGAGAYPAGNPFAHPEFGGGAGCHFQNNAGIDQMDAYDANGKNLVLDEDCQCNYDLAGYGWQDWVSDWINNAASKTGFEYNWFWENKAPSWGLDVSICWVNNVRDMINIQNAIWWNRDSWSNQLIPGSEWSEDPPSLRYYWGWNEIPMPKDFVTNPRNWDCIMIKLPAAICGGNGMYDTVSCLHDGAQAQLGNDLQDWTSSGFLLPGFDNMGGRPGSYVVFAKEWMDDSYNWFRTFYCENFYSDGMQVIFVPIDNDNEFGACYAEWPNVKVQV